MCCVTFGQQGASHFPLVKYIFKAKLTGCCQHLNIYFTDTSGTISSQLTPHMKANKHISQNESINHIHIQYK